MVMGLILERGRGSWGDGVDEALVKTDLKWDSRMFAFVWLSVCSWPLSLRGATPVLSCFLALI